LEAADDVARLAARAEDVVEHDDGLVRVHHHLAAHARGGRRAVAGGRIDDERTDRAALVEVGDDRAFRARLLVVDDGQRVRRRVRLVVAGVDEERLAARL
jgi:hypothetical protein